jgi:hypothetical protein
MSDKTINPTALASLIEAHGGTIVEGPTLRFDLPRSEIAKVIPRINDYHEEVRVRPIRERREQSPKGDGLITITTLECYRSDQKRFKVPWAD